jgi:hypothetical protein
MKRFLAPWSCAGLLAAAAAGLVLVPPEQPTGPAIEPELAGEPLARLERQLIAALNQFKARIRVARAVMMGELTLQQGAEQLHDLHAVNPDFNWRRFRTVYSGATDLERCCRQLQETIEDEQGNDRRDHNLGSTGSFSGRAHPFNAL